MQPKEVMALGVALGKMAQTASLDECLFTAASFFLLLSEKHQKTPAELSARAVELVEMAKKERAVAIAAQKKRGR